MNSAEIEKALAAQATQIADLQAQVAALSGKPSKSETVSKSAPAPQRAEGEVIVTYPVSPTSFVMPSEAELSSLMAIVHKKYPKFSPKYSGRFAFQDMQQYLRGFQAAFEYIGHLGRATELDKKRYPYFWSDQCEDWFRGQGRSCGEVGESFFCALIAHGDVDFDPGNTHEGIIPSYALATFGGQPSKNYWRDVLAGSPLRTPTISKPLYSTHRSEVRAG